MIRLFALSFCCLILLSTVVEAQTTRIRKRPDLLLQEWDQLIDEPLTINNPLYEEDVNQGVNPLYEPKSIILQPSEFWPGYPVRLEVQLESELPGGIPVPRDSYVFDVKLFNSATDELITDFPNGLTFTFDIPQLTAGDIDNMVLGYLDETKNPPEWKVEDGNIKVCGDKGDLVCGKTDHLTTFMIGPATSIPEPSSIAVLIGLLGLVAAWLWRG